MSSEDQASGPCLISKAEVLRRVGMSYPTIWQWMREGRFPRSRQVGSRSMWLGEEIDAWIVSRPLTPLKGDEGRAA